MELREAAQQALEALEVAESWGTWHRGSEAITALRAALAEATIKDNLTVEPVAWMWDYKRLDGHVEIKIAFAHRYKGFPGDLAYVLEGKDATPLYTVPPKRKPLTDEEMHRLWNDIDGWLNFARAIERAHGIGDAE